MLSNLFTNHRYLNFNQIILRLDTLIGDSHNFAKLIEIIREIEKEFGKSNPDSIILNTATDGDKLRRNVSTRIGEKMLIFVIFSGGFI